MSGHEAKISQLEAHINQLKAQRGQLEAKIGRFKAQIIQLDAQMIQFEDQLGRLGAHIENLRGLTLGCAEKGGLPCHQVQLSFYKPLLLSS